MLMSMSGREVVERREIWGLEGYLEGVEENTGKGERGSCESCGCERFPGKEGKETGPAREG